jgi:putative transport protein
MDYFIKALQDHPELAIFLTLALGYLLGRIRIGSFTVGSVTGVLIAGVLVGQVELAISANVKAVFFLLFLFAIGYKVGPQFFGGLRKNGLPQVVLTIVFCVTALIVSLVAGRLLGFDIGTTAGLLAGSVTESATLGTAADAINRLELPAEAKAELLNRMAIAFAVTYLLGTITTAWFLPAIGPKLMRVDLKAECRKLEAEMFGGTTQYGPGVQSAYRPWDLRAFRVGADSSLAGRTVAEIETRFENQRVFIRRIRRGEQLVQGDPAATILAGDVVAIIARRETMLEADFPFSSEVEDKDLLDFPGATLDVVITNKEFDRKPLGEIALYKDHRGALLNRGIFLRKIVRAGTELPFTPATVVNRGDTLTLVGAEWDVERVAKVAGYANRAVSATDMVFVGLGIFLGGMLGLFELVISGIPVGLGTSGGVLLAGLVLGWLRSVYPVFGHIPESALWLFDSLGLNTFIAVIGLTAGPAFFSGLREAGAGLPIACVLIVVLSQGTAVLFGRYVLKMHPGILLGACCGAGTATPALLAVQEAAGSKVPALGYGLPYALGNVLLIVWGTVIVLLMR